MEIEKVHNNCLICQSTKLKSLDDYQKAFLVQCISCGFVFSRQIPTEQELNTHYAGYSRNDYLSPQTIIRYNELLDILEKYRKHNRLLDLGCGVGYFLEVAKKRGWEVYGTEFTENAIKLGEDKGFIMKQGKTSASMFEEGFFDVITSFEVIEHINYPLEETALIYKFLRKDGIFYFTTPNFNSYERKKLKAKYRVVTYPEHLSYYTKSTISKLLNKQGFKKIFLNAHGISVSTITNDQRIKSAPGKVAAGSKDEKLREALDKGGFSKFIKKMLNGILSILGLGNSLKGAYQKT